MLRILGRTFLALAFLCAPLAAAAFDAGQTKTVDGITIYVGMIPAEIVKGHPEGHTEAEMHEGPSNGAHAYHLVVAIFDAGTGVRISDATVRARVASIGLVGERKMLEPMDIEDTVTYGNYFDLPDRGGYTIDLEIWRTGGMAVKVEFSYEH